MTWKQRIDRALKRGNFSEDDKTLSSSWETCVIGEMKLENVDENNYYGMQFYYAVMEDRTIEAQEILRRIQK